jgi:hypothetical protein
MKKLILKMLTSGEFIELLDKNKDGRVDWSEIKSAKYDVWIELGLKYLIPIIAFLL